MAVCSEIGQGSTFTFTFALENASNCLPKPAPGPLSSGSLLISSVPTMWPIPSHRHPKLRCRPCHLGSLGKALVAGIAVNHLLIAMQQLSSGGEVVHVGSRGDD